MFMEKMNGTLNEDFNTSITENGAAGCRTTGKELLDINFSVSSMRNMDEQVITDKFIKTFYENKLLAVKWLFFARDAREGIGERRLFRICMKYLAGSHMDIAKVVLPLISEYGRWDDILCLLDTDLCNDVVKLVSSQLDEDLMNLDSDKPISLLGKWLPSCNTSSKETRRLAHILISKLNITERQYRKILVKLRSYLKVVEVDMTGNRWSEIDYEAVPSRANLIYSNAFLRHDEERRMAYLEKLEKGEAKINASVLFPHDIVHKYIDFSGWRTRVKTEDDPALEGLWKALPDYAKGGRNTICVADGSGSMVATIGGTNVSALDVANALAIYFAERSSGQFKDTYITFSERPQIVDLSNGNSLREKIEIALTHCEVANTDIEAVFDLILKTAINNDMEQEEIPQNILILSDMEFDDCVEFGDRYASRYCKTPKKKKIFDEFADRYARYGYKLPRLVFWNINSRTGTIPVKENELGMALVSGFSPTIVKMVLSNKIDPLECLLEQLNSERYQPVEDAVRELVA